MNDHDKSKDQLIAELEEARRQLVISEALSRENLSLSDGSDNGIKDLMGQSPFGYQIFDSDGTVVWVNPAWEKLWGIKKDFILPTKYNVLRDKEIIELGLMPLVKRGFSGESISIPVTEYNPQNKFDVGQSRSISTRIYPVKDEGGNILKVIFIYDDLTDRVETENHLRLSEEKYRLLVDHQSSLVVKIDPDGIFEYVSPSYCKMFGKTEGELLGHTFMPLVHPDDQSNTAKVMKGLFKPPHTVYLEQRALTSDGWKWLGWSDTAVLDDAGNVTAIIGVGHDITERKNAEESFRTAKDFAENLLETANVMVVTLDTDARIKTFNRHAAHLTGYRREEVLGKNWFKLFIPERDQGKIPEIFGEALKNMPEVSQYENAIVIKDGEERLLSWNNNVLHDSGGDVVGVLSIGLDITGQKQAEEERKSLELQFQHSQKLESLGVLAGGIAHDFNNLLMAILGNVDLALLDLSPLSPVRNYLQEVEKISKRAAELVNQMLAYSGKGKFVLQAIEATELIEEISHLLEVSISKKAILKYNFADNLPSFDADATQVRQVLMNLITNASEAIGEKSGVISLSTGVMECDQAYLKGVNGVFRAGLDKPLAEGIYTYFEVADTGCGMSRDIIEKIFDPFFTTKFTGRGLGLSAVLGIMRGHNGALKIYSEEGRGTTFKVLFPANELEGNHFEILNASQSSDPFAGEGTILIVDDEEDVRTVAALMVERLGFKSLKASDGRVGLEIFREHKSDISCVILDLTMPHMDGEETFREMRRLDSEVTVLLCSGYNEQDATQRFSGKGLGGFIQKPFNVATLKSKLSEIL